MVEYDEKQVSASDSYTWQHRLFLIFTPSPEGDRYVGQRRLLERARDGFAERDLLRGDVFEREAGTFDGGPVSAGQAA